MLRTLDEIVAFALSLTSVNRETFLELVQEQRQYAFTISGFESLSTIEQVKKSLDRALIDGKSFKDWQKEAEVEVEDLASLATNRKKVIYRYHMGTSYNQGTRDYGLRNKRFFPYLRYVAVLDSVTRPTHGANDGVTAPIDDEFWETQTPPLGLNCRCRVFNLSKDGAEAGGTRRNSKQEIDTEKYGKGITPKKIRDEIRKKTGKADKGFSYNKTKPTKPLTNLFRRRADKLPTVIKASLINKLSSRKIDSENYLQRILKIIDDL